MGVRIEAYTAAGVVTGELARAGHLAEVLEAGHGLALRAATWASLDGTPPTPPADLVLDVDEVILASSDEPVPAPGHAVWHEVSMQAGPYALGGELATQPGFDPGRALTRPTGEFVHLRGVRLALLERPDLDVAFAEGLVNRYLVDTVRSDLELGFFFPGAHPEPGVTARPPAAGRPLAPPDAPA